MAIQFPNFLGQGEKAKDYSGIGDLLENALKGYKISQEPARMDRQAEKEKLANQLQQLAVEHKPREYELGDERQSLANQLQQLAVEHKPTEFDLSDRLKEAQAKYYSEGGRSGGPKISKELSEWMFVNPNATQEEIRAKQQELDERKAREARTKAERRENLTKSSVIDKLPTDEKKQVYALGRGLGLTTTELRRKMQGGETLEDIAKSQGKNINDVNPVWALSGENVKQMQARGAYAAELHNLSNKLRPNLGEYSKRIEGMSPQQMYDAVKGKNKDKQARFLAAAALQPELAALRLNVARSRVGIEGIRELEGKALGNVKTLQGLVDSDVYEAMQKYMDKWISEAGNKWDEHLKNYSKLSGDASGSLGAAQEESQSEPPKRKKVDFSKYSVYKGG